MPAADTVQVNTITYEMFLLQNPYRTTGVVGDSCIDTEKVRRKLTKNLLRVLSNVSPDFLTFWKISL